MWVTHGALITHQYTYGPAGLLFPSRCPSGTNLLTPYLMVWDWQLSRAGPMLLYCPKQLYPYYSLLLFFPFLFFLSICWYCGAGVFGLIWCMSLSLSLALPTFLNNNNNNSVKYYYHIQMGVTGRLPHEVCTVFFFQVMHFQSAQFAGGFVGPIVGLQWGGGNGL